ncbi:Pore-forming peptide amoebapore B [Entamoeba marina]
MKAIFFVLFVAFAFAGLHQGEILCNLCVDFITTVEKLITVNGADAARNYIDELCAETSGVLYTLCDTFLNFGVDEIIKLIDNRAQPQVVCEHINLC